LFVLIIDNQDEGISPGGLKRDEKESVQKKRAIRAILQGCPQVRIQSL
jgi:hypothetical protein